MSVRKRVGVLISGNGSNLQALIDASYEQEYPAKIALVISNKSNAFGLRRAAKAAIPTCIFENKAYSNRENLERDINLALHKADCDIVCLAGFMQIFSQKFAETWEGKILNIHPSLLPSFKGLHAQRQALEAGVKITGCTVHLVTAKVDDGPIILQAAVPVMDKDNEASLSARILEQEHQIYQKGLAILATGLIQIKGRRTFIAQASSNMQHQAFSC
ncbi:phosphoribosylglycinamide formyltransferase [Candidatus Endolissoclinum faulkneri L5]|uniref:Phosphoribosylglycinamide formyltransferase n=1 Tax=Candidatus Endolissoclinum faulkneri L5 TaxID=1401328 RepID=V9TW18_9PROT|nr:phosphoribosylglycinamide formyltransferase [Candidatus Endolissoclinum faulkneri]AHC73898.1 phosphoribosylglycinamide formyltransferase [Candidatus Endolissoclinum faulkneri L5]